MQFSAFSCRFMVFQSDIHFSLISKILGDTRLAKMPAELPSTEEIFTETSSLVPLVSF